MSCKNIFLVLGLISFILAIFISSDVAARELTEDTNKNNEKADHTNGLEESKYGGGGGGYGGGGGGGYGGGGGGGYGGGGGGGYGGGGGGHGGGGGYGGRCRYGCCGYGRFYHRCFRCCATASEAAKYQAANPHN